MGPARPSRSPRRVLLVVSNEMTASYLGGVKALFKGREDLVFFVTSAPGRVADAQARDAMPRQQYRISAYYDYQNMRMYKKLVKHKVLEYQQRGGKHIS